MIITILFILADEVDCKHARITINSKMFHQRWLTTNKYRENDFQEKVTEFPFDLEVYKVSCRSLLTGVWESQTDKTHYCH